MPQIGCSIAERKSITERKAAEFVPNLRLATIYGDGMVLQRKVPSKLFGFTLGNAPVSVKFERFPQDGESSADADIQFGVLFHEEEIADPDGYFEFKLPPLLPSFDPCRLTVQSVDEVQVIQDILIGDVWYAAGQDNMAQTVRQSDVASMFHDSVNYSSVRFFQMNEDGLSEKVPAYSYQPLGEAQGGFWHRGDQPYFCADVSAVAFTFAIELYNALHIPVGVICTAACRTSIHAWLPRETIESDPVIKNHVREVRQYRDEASWNEESIEKQVKKIGRELDSSGRPVFPKPQTIALLHGLKPDRPEETPIVVPRATIRKTLVAQDQVPLERDFTTRNQPSTMFNHKVAPFVGLAVSGVLWFHGENDVDSIDYYHRALTRLVSTFESLFEPMDGKLTLVLAQLPPYLYNGLDAFGEAEFNEMLAYACHTLPVRAGLVTLYDLSLEYLDKDHRCGALTPSSKAVVGRRMAKTALGLMHGGDAPRGALQPVGLERIGNKWMVDFSQDATRGHDLFLRNGDTVLKGFSVCDESRVFVKADARILYGVRVLVWHDAIEHPVSIAYGYANFNGDANLIGAGNMPVLPFRADREVSYYLMPMPWFDCDRLTHFAWEEPITQDVPRSRKTKQPGEKPLWEVSRGRASLALVTPSYGYSTADIKLTYRGGDERPVEWDAAVAMASAYPPLNLSPYSAIELVLFNPDHREKTIQLLLEDANGVVFESDPRRIEDTLKTQTIAWKEGELANDTSQITRFGFRLVDAGVTGSLVMVRVVLKYMPPK